MESEQVWAPARGWRVLISAFFIFVSLGVVPQPSSATSERTASVEAVEGQAEIPGEGEGAQEPLRVGHLVSTWQTVTTGQDGKLLLRWDLGIVSSQGALSTLFLSSRAANGGEVQDFQLVEGVLRVSTDDRKSSPTGPYSVTTPIALIQPVSSAEPVDFIVETYDPSSTVVTVLRGQVEVKNLSVEGAAGRVVQSCRSVQIKEGKADTQPLEVYAEDAERLMTAATIPGSLAARLDACPSRAAAATPPVEPPMTAQPAPPHYVQEDYLYDPYPFDDIRVYPPPTAGAGIVVFIPTIGEWIIPYDVYRTWGVGPDLIGVCVRRMLLDQALYYDHYYWNYYRVRQAELYRMAYFGQLARDRGTLRRVLRELDDLRIRQDWMARRIHRLEHRVRDLAREEGRLPARARMNLVNAIASNFDGQKNLHVSQKFRQGLRNRIEAQGRLASLAGQEVFALRSRLSEERDPLRRAAMRNELTDARRVMAEGKMPIPAKDRNMTTLVNEISREQDPRKREDLQRQALKQLGGPQPSQTDLFAQENLNKLQRELTRYPNPRAVPQLEKQLTELKQAVETRRTADATKDKVDLTLSQAAESKDPEARGKLLQQIKQLAPPVAAAGAGLLPRVLEQQRLQNQLAVEDDRRKREELQRRLQEGLKKPPALAIQPTEPTRKPPDKTSLPSAQQPPQPADQILRTEQDRQRLQEQRRQADQMRLQQEDTARKAAEERRRLEELKRQEAERAQIQRRQQDEAARQAEQARRQQEDSARKAAQERQKLEEQRRREAERAQIQRQQQEQAARQAEQARRQQEQAARQAEQVRRQQQEQAQREQLRRQQQEQAARQAEQARRQQQDQAARQAEQIRRQQQQQQAARQADQARRQQEQAARQAQQAQQLRQQQQQQQAAQARQRAEEEKRRQAEQARRQQEEAAKQAERSRR